MPRFEWMGSCLVAAWLVACGHVEPATPEPASVQTVEEPSEQPSQQKQRFRCEVEVSAVGKEVFGEAEREGEGDLSQNAWRKACEALQTTYGLDCEHEGQSMRSSRSQRVNIVNGKMTQSLRIGLRPILGELRGKAGSNDSHKDACQAALDQACEQAPAGAECLDTSVGCEADATDPSLWRCSSDIRRNHRVPEEPGLI